MIDKLSMDVEHCPTRHWANRPPCRSLTRAWPITKAKLRAAIAAAGGLGPYYANTPGLGRYSEQWGLYASTVGPDTKSVGWFPAGWKG